MTRQAKHSIGDGLALSAAIICVVQVFVARSLAVPASGHAHAVIGTWIQLGCATVAAAMMMAALARNTSRIALHIPAIIGCLMLAAGAFDFPAADLSIPSSLFGAMLLVAVNVDHLLRSGDMRDQTSATAS